jgi:flagellar hook-length control protein FliK
MTSVSLAPVSPAVRGTDSRADAPQSATSDKFEALLARASGTQADHENANVPAKRATKSASKDPGLPTRARDLKKQDGAAPEETEGAPSASTIKSHAPNNEHVDTDDEDLVVADGLTQNEDNAIAPSCPVADLVAPGTLDTPTVCGAATGGLSPDHMAAKTEAATAEVAEESNAVTELVASSKLATEAKTVSGPLDRTEKNEVPTPSRSTAPPTSVKSSSWAAAANALREALQKSTMTTPPNASTPQQSHVETASTSPSAAAPLAPAVTSLPLTSNRAPRADASRGEVGDTNEGAERPGVAVAAMAMALGTAARHQSASSHSDPGNEPGANYKAPLKHVATGPAFTASAAFTRALESTTPAAPPLPPSFTSANLSTVGPQLVKGLQLQVTAGGGDMRLTLTPEHLGTVSIEVRVEHDRVRATLTADTPAVRQWIATHQEDLRQRLDAAGLTLEDLVVNEDASQGRQEQPDDRQATPQKRRAPQSDSERAFEVVV